MSDYTKTVNFAAKDSLITGDPNKTVFGSELNVEFDALAVAIATKANANNGALTGTTTGVNLDLSGTLNVGGAATFEVAGQDYTLTSDGNDLVLEGQTVSLGSTFEVSSKNNNNSDDVAFILDGTGKRNDVNFENAEFRFDSGNVRYELETRAAGSGTIRPLAIFTQGNANQLLLNTDGSVSVSNADINGGTVDGAVIGGSSAAAATVTDLTAIGTVTIPDDSLTISDTSGLQAALDLKSPLASPTFTGTVTIPTADINGGAIDGTVIGATSAAAATVTDLSASGTVTVPDGSFSIAKTTGLQAALDLKAPLASPTFTGTVTVPDGSFTVAKTTGLQAALDAKAALAGASFTGNITTTGRAVAGTDTSSVASATTLDFSADQNFVLTMTNDVTLSNPTTETVGQSGFIVFIQDGTGGRTLSLGSEYKTAGGNGITLSTAANAIDIVPYVVTASGSILLGAPQLDFS